MTERRRYDGHTYFQDDGHLQREEAIAKDFATRNGLEHERMPNRFARLDQFFYRWITKRFRKLVAAAEVKCVKPKSLIHDHIIMRTGKWDAGVKFAHMAQKPFLYLVKSENEDGESFWYQYREGDDFEIRTLDLPQRDGSYEASPCRIIPKERFQTFAARVALQ